MSDIVLLDDLTINKIAAGEVIERPASVVKELLENSIDAGSKNITVEIKNGGISMIKITDDGIGISEDDMEIAFERHATSKIRRAEDLATVTSMGFRGEALASISAISKVEMISKKINTNSAYKITVEGGKITDFCETVRNVGTTITVENLFYNTPVRYKFLKKDYTEAGYVEDVVNRIALVNLKVAIKLISNGKTIFQTNGMGDIKNAIYNIYGKDTALETVKVDYEYEEIRVSGVVGNPVIARSNRSNQLFFLNGRYIKDRNITAAVDQAFKGIVPVGRYGFAILNLQMDPKAVDVNVHPAKLEVRFENEEKVFKAVYHAIKSCLTNVNNSEDVKQDTFDFMNSFYQNKKDYKLENTNPVGLKNSKYEYNYNKPINDNWNKRYSADSIDTNSKSGFGFDNKKIDDEKKSSGIVGLFKKIIKEPEETEEEINNNYLADIYKTNYGLGEGTEITIKDNEYNNTIWNEQKTNSSNNINPNNSINSKASNEINSNINDGANGLNSNINSTSINNLDNVNYNNSDNTSNKLNETIQNSIDDKLLNKSIVLGNALISSNTMQINVNDVENKYTANDIAQTVSENNTNIQAHDNSIINENDKGINEAFKKVIENNTNTQEININPRTNAINANKESSNINNTESSQELYNIGHIDSSNDIKNIDNINNIPNIENKESTQIIDNFESAQSAINTQNVESDKNDEDLNDTTTNSIDVSGDTNNIDISNVSDNINNLDNTYYNASNNNNLNNTENVDVTKGYENIDSSNCANEVKNENELLKFDLKQNTSEVYLNDLKKDENTINFDLNSKTELQNNDDENDTIEKTNELNNTDSADTNKANYTSDNNDDAFSTIASEIIEAKMQSDSTQMIDTKKVREALNEVTEEEIKPEFEEMYKKTFGIETFSKRKEKELENLEKEKSNMSNDFELVYTQNENVFEDDGKYKIPYKYIGIAFDNFIIIEIKEEIYIINHTSANGKIIYEQLSNNYFNNEEIDENQFLLLPDIISLTDKETFLARENIEMFAKAGFIYEEFGNNTIKLVSVPSICEKLNTKQLFTDILNELDKVAITEKEEKASKFLATIADKVSSRVSDRLDNDLARNIIDDLLALKEPFGDLLGKPIAIKMTKYDLERKFSRK